MASWILVPCLEKLTTEFNRIAPGRPKKSDGSIGDVPHQQEVSDHNPDETGSVPIHDADKTNEVHAKDVTANLGGTVIRWKSFSGMEAVVQFLLDRCRSGKENRLRYIIFNRRIWEASNGWRQRAYTGASPHDEHAHFSASYDTPKERDTRSWGLEEEFMALSNEDKTWLSAEIRKVVTADADPSARSYSLGGMLTSIEKRTAQLANYSDEHTELMAQLKQFNTTLSDVKGLLLKLTTPTPGA